MSSETIFLQAIKAHVEYLKNIQQNINGVSDYCGTDHYSCEFGIWLHDEAVDNAKVLGKRAEEIVGQLYEPHKQFHYASSEAIIAFDENDHLLAKRSMTKMIYLSDKLIKLLLELNEIADK